VPTPGNVPDLCDGAIALRPWLRGDTGLLAEASADPAIRRYSLSRSQPYTAAEAAQELRDCESTWLTFDASGRPTGSVVITDVTTGDSFGQCGVDEWSAGDVAQIGYWLLPRARRRGLATRAVVLLTGWLFDLGARRVFLTVVEDNHASVRVAQRAGFRLEGPTEDHHLWDGRRYGVLRFAVTAEEWQRE
jgi:RimJ/RimL family protein N-acetyltransferase